MVRVRVRDRAVDSVSSINCVQLKASVEEAVNRD